MTGAPLHNAVIWLDTRTAQTVEELIQRAPGKDKDFFKSRCGLPISTYFSAPKLRWLIDNIPAVREAVSEGRCLFGTVDSWLLWNLTGGVDGGHHLTDVTNASRTMLMNLKTLEWDQEMLDFFDIPRDVLPGIRSSSEVYGTMVGTMLAGVPISGILGDQQAALVGQMCFSRGEAKNTYGTGCFLLYNTGPDAVESNHGLLTTVAYKMGDDPVCYALEGSVAIAGASVQWLRDNLNLIKTSPEIEDLARQVDDSHGCHFVPAFSGLFCPYWQPNARGVICGLSQFTNKHHIARACLEATCFQTRELLDVMNLDSGIPLVALQVDGGMTANMLLMQIQADLLGIPVIKSLMAETTALGAAMAAGAAHGIDVWDIKGASKPVAKDTYNPSIPQEEADARLLQWKKAVQKSLQWEKQEIVICNITDYMWKIAVSAAVAV